MSNRRFLFRALIDRKDHKVSIHLREQEGNRFKAIGSLHFSLEGWENFKLILQPRVLDLTGLVADVEELLDEEEQVTQDLLESLQLKDHQLRRLLNSVVIEEERV